MIKKLFIIYHIFLVPNLLHAITAISTNMPGTIVLRDSLGNFFAGTITANLSGNATTAINFTGSLSGDATGTQSATVVSTVGGQTAANVAAGAVLANAATAGNITSAIVKRTATGGFSAGAVSLTDEIVSNTLTVTPFTSAGIVHNNASGLLSTSLIVNADVDPVAAIVDTKLATISTTGKVANSATTATSANTANTIVARDASGNFYAGTITANLSGNATTATTATTSTNATNFTGSLSGDVTGTQSATVVSTVGGQTAANVAAATVLANAATNLNTASTIVKRDASGNFSAGTITANLSGNAATATTATNFTGSLSGDVTGTQGATVVSTVGGKTAATVAAATVLANAATNLNTANTIVKRDGTGSFAAQVISITDAVSTGNLVFTGATSTSTTGNITKGGNPFIHNTGTSNTFIGVNAGNFTTSGTGQNTAVGVNALTANTTGNNNVAQGYNTLSACTTGSNNIAVGSGAGTVLTTGSNNIYVGATAGAASESNTIRIGTSGVQTACYLQGLVGLSISLSSVVVDSSTGKLGYLLSSQKFKKDIADMNNASSDILKLRPVTFVYTNDDTNTQQFGLIAEEVDELFPAIVVYDEYGEAKTVQYHVLPVLLLNEMKKQQVTIEKMDDIIHDLLDHVQELMARVKKLENNASTAI